MMTKTYRGGCHCGSLRFHLSSEEITKGRRCNCSMCIRKGAVMSARYYAPEEIEVAGAESLSLYQFGDKDVNHYFCKTCGVYPFHVVAAVPSTYVGTAKPGHYRVN